QHGGDEALGVCGPSSVEPAVALGESERVLPRGVVRYRVGVTDEGEAASADRRARGSRHGDEVDLLHATLVEVAVAVDGEATRLEPAGEPVDDRPVAPVRDRVDRHQL